MKVLVVYYSRTGGTRAVAAAIARSIGAEAERIADLRDRDGWFGYLKCAIDQALKLNPPQQPLRSDLTKYDVVVVGTPIWDNTCSAPVRAFLKKVAGKLGKAAFFCVMDEGGNETKTFMDMADFCRTEPFATFAITGREIKGGDLGSKVAAFAEQCRTGMTAVRKKRDGEA